MRIAYSMKVSFNRLLSVIIEIVVIALICIVYFIFFDANKETQIRIVALMAIFVLAQSLLIIWKINHKINCYFILLLLIAVFMFGQHFLFLLKIYPKEMILLRNLINQDAIFKTGILVLNSIVVMNIGYIITSYNLKNKESVNYERNEINKRSIYLTGLIFFAISLVPTIIVLFKNIFLTFTVGYGERMLNTSYRLSGIENISGILSTYMVPSLLAIFIGRKPGQKFPIIAIGTYMILYTLSGSRINTVILLIGTLYIQNMLFAKFNFNKLLKYGICAFAVLLILSTVSVARNSIGTANSSSALVIKNSVQQVVENNPIVSAISEAGYTFSATAVIVDNCPSNVEYKNGMSYVRALAYVLPNGMTGNIYSRIGSADDVFKGYLNQYGSGIGSSFIAEAYWNFGYCSLIIMFIYGMLLGKLSSKLDFSILKRDYLKIFILTYIFITVSFYVRSETSTFFRNLVWFGLPILFVGNLLKSNCLKNKKRV